MDNLTKKEFQNSLDLTSEELEHYIPELLKGLWELGSMPEYIIELIERNNLGENNNIIDLGCGKGAVLVRLAERFDIKAIGIDIVPNFIDEANNYATQYEIADKVVFKTEDIVESLKTITQQDIVIYGYDSEILGDLKGTLRQLTKCIKRDGCIILEFIFTEQPNDEMLTDNEMMNIIGQSGYCILDRIDWNRETLKKVNRQNLDIIQENVKQLISQYADKEKLFNEYMQNQIEECEELENDYFCTTLLLRHSNSLH
jgi:cyclopropane fatty-acyl-phospholipid synthase-like methyltransferase